MRVAFRVDASAKMGIGHVKRCLALGSAIRNLGSNDVLFVSRALGGTAEQLIRGAGFPVELLPAPVPSDIFVCESTGPSHASWAEVDAAADAAQTAERMTHWQPDWVVVDHYSFDSRWHHVVRGLTGARIAAIDDLADRLLAVDLLIDHNVCPSHRLRYAAHLSAIARLLGGPTYALIDPLYEHALRYKFSPLVDSIGLFMGGADPNNATPIVLRACRESGFVGRVEVVSTSANPHLPALVKLSRDWEHTTLSVDLPDLSAFFARHDLQIGAGGGASWERCCIGAPSLIIPVALNQVLVTAGLKASGAADTLRYIERHQDFDEKIRTKVSDIVDNPALRLRLSNAALKLVDGRGATRVALEMATP